MGEIKLTSIVLTFTQNQWGGKSIFVPTLDGVAQSAITITAFNPYTQIVTLNANSTVKLTLSGSSTSGSNLTLKSATVNGTAIKGAAFTLNYPTESLAFNVPATAVPFFYFDNFSNGISFVSFDGSHWPPLSGAPTPQNYLPGFKTGWPTNTGTPTNISGAAMRMNTGNKEAQCYETANIIKDTKGTGIFLTATLNNNNHFQMPWTSGAITLYADRAMPKPWGFYAASMKLAAGQGMWPAFWLLQAANVWPPEIDILEMINMNSSYKSDTMAMHVGVIDGKTSQNEFYETNEDLTTNYYVYGVDIQPDYCTFWWNGIQIVKYVTPSQIKDSTPLVPIFNLAVGGAGSWPGTPNASQTFAQMGINWLGMIESSSYAAGTYPITQPA